PPPPSTPFPYTTLFRSPRPRRRLSVPCSLLRLTRSSRPGRSVPRAVAERERPSPGPTRSWPRPFLHTSERSGARSEARVRFPGRSEEHTSELQSLAYLV